MQWQEIKKDILNKSLPPFVILTGDSALLDIYRQKIFETFKVTKLNTMEEYFIKNNSKFKIMPNTTYFIENDTDFLSTPSTWGYTFTNLILLYDTIDRKSKFYKMFEQNIVHFEPLSSDIIKGLIRNRVDINEDSITWLAQSCDNDYYKTLNETAKLSCFDKPLQQKLFSQFKQDGFLCPKDTLDPFVFSNAITSRDKAGALKLLDKVDRENLIGEWSAIYNSFKNMAIVLTCGGYSADLKMSDKQYMYLRRNCKYTIKEICNILLYIINMLQMTKQGRCDIWEVSFLFVLKFM